ncbi:MAG: hypothetical protein H6705_15140 [Myxococcales bacterium]|nr:hypothetical protein [Myxococcales bacterium]
MPANEGLPTLYVHRKRPEWGLAIRAHDGEQKQRYLFQDGRLRAFPEQFCHFMEPADKPFDVAERVARQLAAQLEGHGFENPAPVAPDARVPFDDQLKVFAELFPGGFTDPDYVRQVRHADKRRKRHRDPAVADARALLSAERLDALIAAGDGEAALQAVSEVLDRTSVCSARDRRVLDVLPAERRLDFAVALRDLLHGEGAYFDRFTRFIAVVDADPEVRMTWPLATVLPALVHPGEHVVIKQSVFRKQAQWMAPRLSCGKVPNAGLYERLRRMAIAVREKLEAAGHRPRDLFDVYDFIWSTLRPKALQILVDDEPEAEAA